MFYKLFAQKLVKKNPSIVVHTAANAPNKRKQENVLQIGKKSIDFFICHLLYLGFDVLI